jgi:hypothetical protein
METKRKRIQKKQKYVKPEIKEVWDENIGMRGIYLLEIT